MMADDDWLAPQKAKFAAALPAHREALVRFHAEGDREGMIDRAHKLAGISGMLGAPEVGEAALLFEEALLACDETAERFAALLDAIDRTIG